MNLFKIKDEELKNSDAIKALMMLIIVFYHCCCCRTGGGILPTALLEPKIISYFFKLIIDFCSSFQNQTFVFVSGYIFSFVLNERQSYVSFNEFIGKKARRLLIPFMFILLFWQIPIRLLICDQSSTQIIHDCVLASNPDQLHFILMLFWVFVIAWFVVPIWNNKPYISCAVLIGVYYLGSFVDIYATDYFRLLETCKELLFFFMGYSIRFFDCKKIRNIRMPIWAFLWAVFFILSEIMQLIKMPGYTVAKEIICLPLHIVAVLSVFFILNKAVTYFNLNNNSFFIMLSKRMMGIYLLHQQLIYLVVLMLGGKINSILLVLVSFVVTTVISFIITSILLRVKVTRTLIGEK